MASCLACKRAWTTHARFDLQSAVHSHASAKHVSAAACYVQIQRKQCHIDAKKFEYAAFAVLIATAFTCKRAVPAMTCTVDVIPRHTLAGPNMTSAFPGTDGGRPMMLDGKIVLCTHSDPSLPRHYNGGISQLSIYDTGLNPEQVQALFNQVSQALQFQTSENL